MQVIQSLDGGILQALYVQEGNQVSENQPLARIDDTRFRADFAQQAQETDSLLANIIRLRAELASIVISTDKTNTTNDWQQQVHITKQPPQFPPKLQQQQKALITRQQAEFHDRLDNLANQLAILGRQIRQRQQEMAGLKSKITTLSQSYQLVEREMSLTRPLADKGIVPEVELLKLERSVNDIQGELASLKLMQPKLSASLEEAVLKRREAAFQFSTQARAKLSELQTRLSRMTEAQVSTADKVNKAVITSPVNGTVKTLHINTLGGVVKPGVDIIEIVPTEDQLLIETRIAPKDIAFLHPGLPAVVKVTAYDFTRYGGLNGTVEHIGADTIQDEEGNSFYLIKVRTDKSSLTRHDGEDMPIIPGMLTSVDIITGKRTILEYILNPILRARETALRER